MIESEVFVSVVLRVREGNELMLWRVMKTVMRVLLVRRAVWRMRGGIVKCERPGCQGACDRLGRVICMKVVL